jgi:hypothetical protein
MHPEQIESLLNRIKPKPGPSFHQRMQNQPWAQTTLDQAGNRFLPRRLAVLLSLVTLFVLIFSLMTPTLKVVAQRWLQFFLPAIGNQATMQVPQEEIDNSGLDFSLTISAAEKQAGFLATLPASLPDGYSFAGVAYQAKRQAIVLNYVMQDNQQQLLISQRPQGPDFQKIGGDALVEIVAIGEISGEYVSGAWTIPEVKSSRDEIAKGQSPTLEITWDPEAGIQILRWQKDQLLFEIIFAGNNPEISGYLTKPDLIAIAETMH